ncbi:MAG: putative manganese-dependent inorganic diphosphatase [Bacilli bacterium]|nr:putative manganese-dependent inorganic diphosphatase [Bacilli bacterium]
MNKIFVFGHRKPDTDSVTSAISLSYLKNQLGIKTEPRVLGDINRETQFVLNYFNVEKPKLLNDVKLQVKDVNYHKDYCINEKASIKEVYDYMITRGITGIPLVNDNKEFVSLVTVKNIVKSLINGDFNYLSTSYDNIVKVLDGEKVLKSTDEIEGNITVASFRSTTFLNNVDLCKNDVLIVGDRHSIIEYAVNCGVKLIIITGNGEIKEEHINVALSNHVNIIRTNFDTFHTAKMIGLCNYIKNIVEEGRAYTFDVEDYYDDFVDMSAKLKHNNYPVVDKNNICRGLIRITDIDDKDKKKVILVDHNEEEQSVEGLNEAEIIEVVDHHKIGNISTNNPINFRNMSVGSTNTIIYNLYKEAKIEIPYEIKGLMLSGILSDTLVLSSPTTTKYDIDVVEKLASDMNIDYKKYSIEMFKEGTSLKGKTKEEIINVDAKLFNTDDKRFIVSQVFTLDFDEINKEKDDYIRIIDKIKDDRELEVYLLVVTDIVRNGSYVFYNDSSKNIVGKAFGIPDLYQGYYMGGIVSRKKQLVPNIMEVIR